MKKHFLLFIAMLMTGLSFGQLAGIKTIPGDYATISAAITALNAQGVGAGGVTFNVAAGTTETFATVTAGLITATGTLANPIIFQKSGAGVNPRITAGTPGISTSVDFIICLAGSDYITFDGIDLQDNALNLTPTTQMEWGYALVKKQNTAPFDGCQNVTIKNCAIILNKTNTASIGIYAGNHISTLTTALTITATTDALNNCKFYGNNISNCYGAISLGGFAALTPFTLYDQNNEIGVTTGNTISNLGAGSSSVRGIYAIYQNGLKIAGNNMSWDAGGSTTTVYGIFTSSGTSSNVDIYNNIISLNLTTGTFTSTVYGINNAMGSTALSNVINIYNNTIQSCNLSAATTGAFQAIVNSGTGATVNIYGNTISNNTLAGTGEFNGIYNSASMSTNTANIYTNTINGNSKTGSGGSMYCTRATTATIVYYQNNIYTNSITSGTGSLYGYSNAGSPVTESYYNNNIYGLTTGGTGSVYGFYILTAGGTKTVYGNNIYLLSSGGGTVYGYSSGYGTPHNFYNNNIYNLTSTTASGVVYGISFSSPTLNCYNNFISDLKAPAATGLNAVVGMNLTGGTTQNVYNNTVYLNAVSSSATTFGSSGIYKSASTAGDYRNNVIVNVSVPGPTGGFTVAHRWSAAYNATYYALTSNNNDFYAGTPAANKLIFYDGTTSYQTIGSYISAMAPRESASFSENPPFINSATTPYNLHINTAIPTFVESGGSRVTTPIAVSTDFDNNIRWGETGYAGSGSSPDAGADEFNGLPIITCTPPVPGNTLSTGNNLCSGQSISLSLQNAITGTGNTYQWKSSPDNITYTNVSGANSATLTLTPTASLYYECMVTCLNGPVSATSAPLLITFINSVTSSTPATRCGTGTVSLQATTSSPGATLRWYNIPTGGASLGSGSPFITPVIPATTTFYVGAETNSAGSAAIGAGATTSSTYPDPFYSLWSNTHNQYLILASELMATGISAGNLNSLSLNVTSGTMAMADFSIKMGHTTATNMSAFLSPVFTTVYTAAVQTPIVGLNTMTFSTPFIWDGISNIVIEICHGDASSSATMSSTCTADNTPYVSTIHVHKSSASAGGITCADLLTNLSTYSVRPNFTFSGTVICSSPRSAVVATVNIAPPVNVTANPTTVCGGQNSILTASSANAGYTYTWVPATTPATGSPVTANPIVTTTYTVNATDNSGGPNNGCSMTATATITVTLTPSAVTITPPSASINLGQTQQLQATGGYLTNVELLHENFNTSAPAWVITNGPTSPLPAAWHYEDCPFSIVSHAFTNFSTLDGGKFAFSNADLGGTGSTTVSMLTSPSFSTTGYIAITLTFEQIYYQYIDDLKAAVEISTNGGSSWITLTDYFLIGSQGTTTSNAQATTTTTIDLSAYANQPNLKIRYHYQSMWGYYWLIDNVKITGSGPQPITWTPVTSLFTDAGATIPYVSGTPATDVYAKPASTITYTATTTAPTTCTSSTNVTVTVNPPSVGGTIIPASVIINLGITPPTLMLNGYTGSIVTWQERINGGTWNDIPGTAGVSSYSNTPTAYGLFEYRVIVQSGTNPIAYSSIASITVIGPPTVTTNPASNITLTGAQLNGTVNANNASTTVSFEWGLTAAYGNTIPAIPATVNGTTPTAVLATLIGLLTNTTYHYRCVGTSIGGTTNGLDQSFLTGCPQPAPAGPISGPISVCQNGNGYVYSVGTIVNAVSYAWTVPAGGSIVSGGTTNSITVNYSTIATSGNVTVAGVGTCGSGTPSSLAVTVNPMPVPTITGPASSCAGSTTNIYVTQPGMTLYTWTVSTGGTITAGGTTNTITVTWATSGAKTVTVNYNNSNGCSAAVAGTYAVTVNVAPIPTITGATSMCVNSGYFDYVTQPGFTGYVWTISAGGVINYGSGTNQIQVSWIGSGPQWVAVNYNNASGCAASIPTQLAVTVNPPPAAASSITGTSTVCGGTNGVAYSTAAISGALTYVWSLPAGAVIATGAGTNSITVNFAGNAASGNITVYGNNLCGNGTVSTAFPVTVNPLPAAAGTITGPAAVCNGATGVVYTIPAIIGATSYNWTTPTGATITSGANTPSITVDFALNAVSGNITVSGSNTCGSGPASPNFAVTVNPIPATPVITAAGPVLTSSAVLGNQWYFSATMGGIGTPISGATGQTHTASLTGYYWDVVTLAGCSSDTSNNIYVVMIGINNLLEASAFTVYPVPTDGKFTVSFSAKANQVYSISVFNSLGSSIFEQKNIQGNGTTEQIIDLRPVAPGVYTVLFSDGANRLVKKIVVR